MSALSIEDALASGSPDGVVIVGYDGKVRYANPASLTLFDGAAEKIQELFSERPLADEEPSELRLPFTAGERFVELRAARIEWENSEARLVTIRDVTGLKRLERLRAAVSHELRTPLSVVALAVNTILKRTAGPLRDEQDELLRTANRNISRLTRILDDYFDLSRLESASGSDSD